MLIQNIPNCVMEKKICRPIAPWNIFPVGSPISQTANQILDLHPAEGMIATKIH
jgi:hypothetical protein